MIKLLGSIIIIISATLMGIIYSQKFSIKVNQIRDIEFLLNMLENEITFTSTPLVQAFINISNKGCNSASKLFLLMSEELKSKKCNSVYDAFKLSYDSVKEELYFDNDELQVIGSFMKSLGNTDTEGQKKNFNITIKKLESFEKKAEDLCTKNAKLYRYLGVCAGTLIVIILI